MVLSMMVRCMRLAKRGLVFTAVLFFTSLLMKELTSSLLPPLPGARSTGSRGRHARTRGTVRAVVDQRPTFVEDPDIVEAALNPNETEAWLIEETRRELNEMDAARGDTLGGGNEDPGMIGLNMSQDGDMTQLGEESNQSQAADVAQWSNDVNQQPLGQPGVMQQGLGQPGMEQQGIGQPGIEQQAVGQPGIGQPGIGQPGIGQPGIGLPAIGQPGIGQPGVGQTGIGQPVFGQQGIGQDGIGQQGLGQTGMGQQELGQQSFGQQGFGQQPGVGQAAGFGQGAGIGQGAGFGQAAGGQEGSDAYESEGGGGEGGAAGGQEGPGGIQAGDQNFYIVYVTNTATSETIYIQPSGPLFKFRVKACSDAYLLYKQKISASDKFSYHLGFGYGTKTVIWKKPPEPMTKEFRTPKGGRMNCERTVTYWVNHIGASFSVGFGMNDKPYMEWTDTSNPYPTMSMTLANPWPKKQAVWFLDMSTVKILRVDTGKEYSYEQLWLSTLGKGSVVLQVKACRDVHILLSDKFGAVGNVYEVALGIRENQLTTMREEKFGPNVAAAETEGILDCNEFKAFWLQWTAGKVQVGRGTRVGARKILEHTKVNHPRRIKSIALSTGWGATGRWLFNMDQASLFPS